MVRIAVLGAIVALAPVAAMAQSVVAGQQNNRPSMSLNQPQQQTDNSQQPPQAKTLPPTARAQKQPNPLPQLSN